MNKQSHLQCPVCGVNFSGDKRCKGCNADLTRLMEVAARSLSLRQQARQALCGGQYSEAYQLSTRAQDLHRTPIGQKLVHTAKILDAVCIGSKS